MRRRVRSRSTDPRAWGAGRLTLGFLGVVLFVWALLLAQKALFVWVNWEALRASGFGAVAHGLAQGLRFEAATLGYVLSPALVLFYAVALTGWRSLRWLLTVYVTALAVVITVIGLADLRGRCVMTTFDPDTLEQNHEVLAEIVHRFDGRLALNAAVIRGGVVRVGDEVELLGPEALGGGLASRTRG